MADPTGLSPPVPCTMAGKAYSSSTWDTPPRGLGPVHMETVCKWTNSLRRVHHLPYNMYRVVLNTNERE